MVDKHRRVESRQIVGTGMATDPERIEELKLEQERRARAWRDAPEVGFGDVLEQAPARGTLEGDEDAAPDRRRKKPVTASSESSVAEAAAAEPTEPPPVRQEVPAPAKPQLPRVPPDPRARLLNARLDQKLPGPAPRAPVVDTPPTGTTQQPLLGAVKGPGGRS
jgi:hypothetical protein